MLTNPYEPPSSQTKDRQEFKRGFRKTLGKFFSVGMGLTFAMAGLVMIVLLVRIEIDVEQPKLTQAFQNLWDLKLFVAEAFAFIAIGLFLIWLELRSFRKPSPSDSVEPPSPQ